MNANINIKNFNEREFHPFLNYYLDKVLGIAAKTIFQEKSTNSTKGENEWIHPDMVGFSLPTSKWNEKVANMGNHFHIPRVIIYSFELKKEVIMSNLREVFFQAVSNSSWSNEGYLVCINIDENDDKLMKKVSRLSSSFGIGVIKLNLEQPENSRIIYEAKRKENIDWEFVNHLYEINQDFKEFVRTLEDSLKINNIIKVNLDKIKSKNELNEILNKGYLEVDDIKIQPVSSILNYSNQYNWEDDVTGKKPNCLMINGTIYEVSTWKDVYITFCTHFSRIDRNKFNDISENIKGKKKPYFSKKSEELRIPYFLKGTQYFIEINLSASLIIKIIIKILNYYNFDKNDVSIFIE
jgi:hypothetical protein